MQPLFSLSTFSKKLTVPYLLVLLTLLLASSGAAQQQQSYVIETGLPINFVTLTLHVHGQAVTVNEIVVSLYPMNTSPPWPTGLWLYTYVQADPGSGINKSSWGQGQWCHWWFNYVAGVEAQNYHQVPFPYFEMNLPASVAMLQTDEQIPIYPAGSVTCWQAMNGYAP